MHTPPRFRQAFDSAPATLRNLHRFWPLLAYYGTKALKRAGRDQGNGSTGHSNRNSARILLWQEPEVGKLLKPASMKSAELFDPDVLRAFTARSRETNFSEDSEWRRLFTLECALEEAQA